MNIAEYISEKGYDPYLLATSKDYRIKATKLDPILFAFVYCPDHITDPGTGRITLNEFHLAIAAYGRSWIKPVKKTKVCFLAPRESGKSTWGFTLLPLWAAAHLHRKFIAAFSDSANQAQQHLRTFYQELQENDLLRADFPRLCERKVDEWTGKATQANRESLILANGFIFFARGIDTASLGLKVGTQRPDLIILDDIEKGESNYSDKSVRDRIVTLQDDIFFLGARAQVLIIGTTTMPDGIIDQIRKYNTLKDEDDIPRELEWVEQEEISCQHFKALRTLDGKHYSIWPEKWSVDFLLAEQGTRKFSKNFQCEPISEDEGYWNPEDIIYVDNPDYGRVIISVDPAVSTKQRSDFSGIAVVARHKDYDQRTNANNQLYVLLAEQVKLGPTELRQHVSELVSKYGARIVYIETNNGGDTWDSVFYGVPYKVIPYRSNVPKTLRAQQAVDYYQRKEVLHAGRWAAVEMQLFNFPGARRDDMVDAISAGVLFFKRSERAQTARVIRRRYIGG